MFPWRLYIEIIDDSESQNNAVECITKKSLCSLEKTDNACFRGDYIEIIDDSESQNNVVECITKKSLCVNTL